MWVVEQGDARVVLFGGMAGVGDRRWLTETVRGAVVASDVVWCEVPDAPELASHPLVAELGLSPDERLVDRLGSDRARRLGEACQALGIEPHDLEGVRPWLVAQVLDGARLAHAGIDPADAPEQVIPSLAREEGIPLRWELGVEEALGFFGELPRDEELALLDLALDRVDDGNAILDADVASWRHGDLGRAEEAVARTMRRSPELHDRLGPRRNLGWVERIERMLHQSGSHFVLVGLLHLVGGRSIPALLEARGHAVARR
ncbi:MAG: TraB/GumN family protein [Acidimicrobiia bacterium]|nr:TraB/GumN family protein [Acidimicrobiia bacterium]